MKKSYLLIMVFAFMGMALQARPVSEEMARRLGQSFVTANFEFTRQSSDLTLVQTAYSDRGEACYYIFNVGETGFVILAADDQYRPIIGYSEEGIFDINDMAPALVDFLEVVRQGVMEAFQAPSAKPDVAADWMMLGKTGRLVSRHGGREAEYLVDTKWNQNYPYNYYSPIEPSGPGGHCYAGCVATAASQLVKYWNHPVKGMGSYCYYHDVYGQICADFGATNYDWENMPVSISANSPLEQIEAIALLQYHVGISVDMNFGPTGSGAVTNRLTQSMPQFFGYTNAMTVYAREDYSHEEYMNLLINTFDMNWPIVQAGGGHAYVFDGYNDHDQIHVNWGWGGSSDGWFNLDEHGYTDGQRGIFNFVPAEIYAATPNAPTDLIVTPSNDNSLTAVITWKNPTLTMNNGTLGAIDQIVVARNGQVVYAEDNVIPGAEMSFVDETIPYFDAFDYAVYAVTNGRRGASAFFKNALVGPTCNWKIIMQSTAFQGWNGGYFSLYSVTGREIQRMTLTTSIPTTFDFAVPVGNGSLGWTAPNNNVNNMTVIVKDAEGSTVYTYSGASSGIEEGIVFEFNNGCGNELLAGAPYHLTSEVVDGTAKLTWDFDGAESIYGYNVYRDEYLYGMVNSPTEFEFVDENITEGHCYTVTALSYGGETAHSNETCASSGDCMGAKNFDYEYVSSNYKVKLLWDRPEVSDGLSGYYLFRKMGEDGTYQRIKLLNASATSYTDNTTSVEGTYYYRLYAYYAGNDCTSSPASTKDDPNKFYLKVYYSPTDIEESSSRSMKLFPNPVNHVLKIEAEDMTFVSVYNQLGQLVYESKCEANILNVNVSEWSEGLYLVKVSTRNGQLSHRITVVH